MKRVLPVLLRLFLTTSIHAEDVNLDAFSRVEIKYWLYIKCNGFGGSTDSIVLY